MKKSIQITRLISAGILTTQLIFLGGCSKEQEITKESELNTKTTVSNSDSTISVSTKSVSLPSIPSGTFNITSYGASTSSSDNTSAIQKAINAAYSASGGTVVVPSGTFLCGPISLKNNVGLQLSSGAVLKVLAYGTYPNSGSTDDLDPFIDLNGLSNISISGSGTIEGQGSAWWTAYKTTKAAGAAISRPCLIGLGTTTIASISGITIQNAPNSHIGIGKKCENITISGVTINSPSTSPNTDGIDTWSPNINITNCSISCGDDNIAMNNNSEYITITGCSFGSGHGCSIGSYAYNINHITVNNCTFTGTSNGIRIKSNRTRGGVVQYLTYSNLVMKNVATPINLCTYYPDSSIPSSASSDAAQTVTSTTPNYKHITFTNITATGATTAGLIWGLPEQYISDVVFDDVQITATKGMTANFVKGMVFENNSSITVSSGNAFISTYKATITGIDLETGEAE